MPAENEYMYDQRRGPRDRGLRVGDREREAVAEILRRQHVEGRLDFAELNDRLERCLSAKTYRELDQLVADFPAPVAERRRSDWVWPRPRWPMAAVLPAVFALAALIAANVLSDGRFVWLAFPVFFLVVRPLLWRSWRGGYGRGPWGYGPRSSTRSETRV
jgi:hypothetical protein